MPRLKDMQLLIYLFALTSLTHILLLFKPATNITEYEFHFFVLIASGCLLISSVLTIAKGGVCPVGLGKIQMLYFLILFLILGHLIFFKQWRTFEVLLLSGSVFGLSQLCWRKKNERITLFLFLSLNIIVAIYFFLSRYYATAPGLLFLNSGPNAIYFATISPFILAIFLNNSVSLRCSLGILSLSLLILSLVIVAMSNSRTSWVAFFLGIFIVIESKYNIIVFIRRMINWKGKIFIPFILLYGFVHVGILLYQYKESSSQGRLLIYKISGQIMMDTPTLGSGFNTFQALFNDYQAEYFKNNNDINQKEALIADSIKYAFNEYLQVSIELGFIGLALVTSLLYAIFRARSKNYIQYGARASLISLAVSCLFSYPLHILSIFLITQFFLSALANYESKIWMVVTSPKLNSFFSIISIFFVLTVVISEYFQYKTLDKWEKAANFARVGDFTQALLLYQEVYPALKRNGDFLYNFGAELSVAGYYRESIEVLNEAHKYQSHTGLFLYLGRNYKKLDMKKQALASLNHACYMVPAKFSPKYHLLLFFEEFNMHERGIILAKKILAQPVKVPSYEVSQIKDYALKYLKEHQ